MTATETEISDASWAHLAVEGLHLRFMHILYSKNTRAVHSDRKRRYQLTPTDPRDDLSRSLAHRAVHKGGRWV